MFYLFNERVVEPGHAERDDREGKEGKEGKDDTPYDIDADARHRGRSTVSLRDIQRVFAMLKLFSEPDMQRKFAGEVDGENERDSVRRALLLTIGVVYYLRLGPTYREQFDKAMRALPSQRGADLYLTDETDDGGKVTRGALSHAMYRILDETQVSRGIAKTRGLAENVFMTFVCTLARIPLIIIGPPGSSKTLAVALP